MRVEPAPGQNIQTAQQFNFTRGLMDSVFEQAVIPTTPNSHPLSSFLVLEQAEAQGVSLALLTSSNASDLDTLNLPADAKARISSAIEQGMAVLTPIRAVDIGGSQGVGWYEFNPTTGEMTGVLDNGGHLFADYFSFNQQEAETESAEVSEISKDIFGGPIKQFNPDEAIQQATAAGKKFTHRRRTLWLHWRRSANLTYYQVY